MTLNWPAFMGDSFQNPGIFTFRLWAVIGVGNIAFAFISSCLYDGMAWSLICAQKIFSLVGMPLRQKHKRLNAIRLFQREGNFFVVLLLTPLFSKLITHLVNWFN